VLVLVLVLDDVEEMLSRMDREVILVCWHSSLNCLWIY
jgi:hypothetical protein